MDATQELLRAILSRLEELSADVKGLSTRITSLEGSLGEFRAETGAQLNRMEARMGHLAEKWMEHDEEIYRLKRRQA